jgi:signal transduction histidine kinase
MLAMMIGNLLDNALRYTPAGGRIDLAIDTADDAARLSVIDTGPGIPPADRERVFERFYRGRMEDAGQGTGSGLGLSIVRRIANAHGATVALGEGPDGRGLAVDVRFLSPAATHTLTGLPETARRTNS